jgi:chemotaxis regulatin CheY-phosphate phosphatase CheZ
MVPGEAGYGLYTMIPNPKMRAYYTRNGESLFRIRIKSSAKILDLTKEPYLTQLVDYARIEIERMKKSWEFYIPPKITKSNVQRQARIIEDFLRANYPDTQVYIVKHMAPDTDLPSGKQVIIKTMDAVESVEKIG